MGPQNSGSGVLGQPHSQTSQSIQHRPAMPGAQGGILGLGGPFPGQISVQSAQRFPGQINPGQPNASVHQDSRKQSLPDLERLRMAQQVGGISLQQRMPHLNLGGNQMSNVMLPRQFQPLPATQRPGFPAQQPFVQNMTNPATQRFPQRPHTPPLSQSPQIPAHLQGSPANVSQMRLSSINLDAARKATEHDAQALPLQQSHTPPGSVVGYHHQGQTMQTQQRPGMPHGQVGQQPPIQGFSSQVAKRSSSADANNVVRSPNATGQHLGINGNGQQNLSAAMLNNPIRPQGASVDPRQQSSSHPFMGAHQTQLQQGTEMQSALPVQSGRRPQLFPATMSGQSPGGMIPTRSITASPGGFGQAMPYDPMQQMQPAMQQASGGINVRPSVSQPPHMAFVGQRPPGPYSYIPRHPLDQANLQYNPQGPQMHLALSAAMRGEGAFESREFAYSECFLRGLASSERIPQIGQQLIEILTDLTGSRPQMGIWKSECWRAVIDPEMQATAGGRLMQSQSGFNGELWIKKYAEPQQLRDFFCLRMYSPEHLVVPSNFSCNARRVNEATVSPQFVKLLPILGFRRRHTNDVYVAAYVFHYSPGTPEQHLLILVQKHYRDETMTEELFPNQFLVEVLGRVEEDHLIDPLSRRILDFCRHLQPLINFHKL